ncbi:MAG: efflux transporter periplasmic adaptor subunit, partial [Methylomonas sp.]
PAVIEASGAIAPWQEAVIGAPISGLRLIEVRANVGDKVKRDQLLARFDAGLLHAEEAQLMANLVEAEATARQAQTNRDRVLKLKGVGSLSEQDLLQYVTQAESARARANAIRAQVAAKQLQLNYTQVKAPDSGVISSREATLGAVAISGQELFRLIRQNRLEWRGELTASQLSQIQPGQSIQLSLPDGSQANATLRQTAPAMNEQSRLGLVYADIENNSNVRAGMYATGRIVLASSAALVLPAASVIIRDGRSYVVKLNTSDEVTAVSLQAVSTGRREHGEVEITQGLAAVDWVVVQGAGFLNDGDWVRVSAGG